MTRERESAAKRAVLRSGKGSNSRGGKKPESISGEKKEGKAIPLPQGGLRHQKTRGAPSLEHLGREKKVDFLTGGEAMEQFAWAKKASKGRSRLKGLP